jgi:hypothetical protein
MRLLRRMGKRDRMDGLDKVMKAGVEKVCHQHHLRVVAGITMGLLMSRKGHPTTTQLRETLKAAYNARDNIIKHHAENWEAFQEEMLIPFRFKAVPQKEFQIDGKTIFERFNASWEDWEKDGTIIVEQLVGYLGEQSWITDAIDTEFELYRHHYMANPSESSLGFLRNMFHSIIQQLLRQDPVIYALRVAGLEDHNFRQIGYPYQCCQLGSIQGESDLSRSLNRFGSDM